MFNAAMSDVRILRDSIDTISQIIDEGVFKINKEGVELVAADRAMVAVVDFRLSSKCFDEFNCDLPVELGLNLLNFLAVLKRAGSDKVNLNLLEEQNRLEIKFTGDSERNFAIPILAIKSSEVPPINQFEFPALAEVSAGIVSNGIDDANTIADSAIFEMDANQFRIIAETDASKTELKLTKGSPALIHLSAQQEVKSRYPLEYLKKILKASKISDVTKISLGNDYPLKIEFSDSDKLSLKFILAPRVSED